MSKSKNIIIAGVLIIIGIIGILLCTIPSISKEQKVINNYINAINNCDLEGIEDCLPLEEVKNMLGTNYNGIFGSYSNELNTILDYMKMSDLSAYSELPEDIKEVKKVSLVSVNKDSYAEEDTYLFYSKTITVDATIEVTYVDVNDNTISFTTIESFQLLETSNGYKIASV